MIDGESNFISTQAINMIYYKTKPDWAEGDLHNSRRVGETVSPGTWSPRFTGI